MEASKSAEVQFYENTHREPSLKRHVVRAWVGALKRCGLEGVGELILRLSDDHSLQV